MKWNDLKMLDQKAQKDWKACNEKKTLMIKYGDLLRLDEKQKLWMKLFFLFWWSLKQKWSNKMKVVNWRLTHLCSGYNETDKKVV